MAYANRDQAGIPHRRVQGYAEVANDVKARIRGGDRARIVIADPDRLVRRALRDCLQSAGGFVVPGEASTLLETIELCRYYRPDAVVLEPNVAEQSEAAVVAIQEAAPSVRIVVRSRQDDPESQIRALTGGAAGFVPKSAGIEAIVPALRAVVRGEASVPPRTTVHLVHRLRRASGAAVGMRPIRSPLTEREWEVLDLLTEGLETQAIASALELTPETVYSHVKSVLRKLGVHSREEAIAVADLLRNPLGRAAPGDEHSRQRIR